MSVSETLPYQSKLDAYERVAEVLFEAVKSGVPAALWRFKWEHPKFRGKTPADVKAAALELADAQLVVAHVYGFESWSDLAEFAAAATTDGPVRRFEEAVEAVVAGDVAKLQVMLNEDPELIRSAVVATPSRHAASLHRRERRRELSTDDAVKRRRDRQDVARRRRRSRCAGRHVRPEMHDDEHAGFEQSSRRRRRANVARGTAGRLRRCAGRSRFGMEIGRHDGASVRLSRHREGARETRRTDEPSGRRRGIGSGGRRRSAFSAADEKSRHAAFALAAQHGHVDVVRFLLDAGEDPSRYNPEGFHSHSTPLHQAVLAGHMEVVRLLVERGARLDVKDAIYQCTPLGWAEHGGQTEIADYLRTLGAPAE